MINKVRNERVLPGLESSLGDAAILILGLTDRRDVLDLARVTYRSPGTRVAHLHSNADIGKIFETSGGMVIVGEPGSGKTTLLLQLADKLLIRAENELPFPIAVVFNLASWRLERKNLAEWMADELIRNYGITLDIAKAWIEEDAIIPLLDGLDEVASAYREELVERINAFHRDRGLVPLVVCCRTRDLQDIPAKLRLENAVELQPPSDWAIDNYLNHLEKTGTSLADLRAMIRIDPTLHRLLRSPLMLHVITLAYHGLPGPVFVGQMSLEERQAILWDAYVDRMFEHRPVSPHSHYSEQQARLWIYWLARMLKDLDQTEFQLDRLTPSWLPGSWPARARTMAGLATGLITGVIGSLAFGFTFGLIPGASIGAVIAIVLGVDAGLSGTSKWRSFPLVEEMHWSGRRMLLGLPIGLGAGLIVAPLVYLVHGFYGALGFALAGALGGALIGGVTSVVRDERAKPNEGIRRSVRHALRFGLTAGLGAALIGGFTAAQGINPAVGVGIGVAGAMTGGLAIGLMVNSHTGIAAVLSHYSVRVSLARLGRAPWRYVTFLDGMTERQLLRQGGSSYSFVHRLLRDHIADSPTHIAGKVVTTAVRD